MAAAKQFRTKFTLPHKDLLHWFPGHMNKGMRQMQQRLKMVDCLIEVHDARIPFTGRNPMFSRSLGGVKPHILVLNKKDLTPTEYNKRVREQIRTEEKINHVIYTNCKDENCGGTKMIRPLIEKLIKESERFNRSEEKDYNVMIIGVPNVGKSSLINRMRSVNMRKAHVLLVGDKPGVTKAVHEKMRISWKPSIFMLDTPGILEPSVKNIESGMKLAACASLQDHLVGEEMIADYLLFLFNKYEIFTYVDFMGVKGPTDDINEVLIAGAIRFNLLRQIRNYDNTMRQVPDMTAAAKRLIRAFRIGELGKMFLDLPKLKSIPTNENDDSVDDSNKLSLSNTQ